MPAKLIFSSNNLSINSMGVIVDVYFGVIGDKLPFTGLTLIFMDKTSIQKK
ncbi:MAG: hypothetical protein F6K35_20430 [Okeania sp. SIO2H7]|nr:hypothetical protein [Okeania sp. SIO2H7]